MAARSMPSSIIIYRVYGPFPLHLEMQQVKLVKCKENDPLVYRI